MMHEDDGQEERIMATADNAIVAKFATVCAGYYADPFLEPFCRRAAGRSTQRRSQPIIRRGTHARVCCMDRAILAFRNHRPTEWKQVLVLGCGKDTSFFRHNEILTNNIAWVEVDHPSVLQTKAHIVQQSPTLFASTVQPTPTGFSISTTTSTCHLIGHDLMESPMGLIQKLQSTVAVDLQAPTLILLECVLMYVPGEASRALLSCLVQHFPHAVLCCYEPIIGTDPFGTVMEQNLIQAGVAPNGSCLRTTRSLPAQLDKLVECGFQTVVGCDMADAYETIVTPEQRKQANKCDVLDEVEEWLLIMRHYCFLMATASSSEGEHFCQIGPESALGFRKDKCQTKTRT